MCLKTQFQLKHERKFFYSVSHGKLHPMEGHSGEPQVESRLTTRKKVAIEEGDMGPFYEDCEGNS
jgi:hypothetical protein